MGAIAVINILLEQIRHEMLCRIGTFFGTFKHENDASGPLVFDFLQDFSFCKQHGNMAVMTAGVHYTRIFGNAYTFLIQIGFCFLNRKTINIGTHQDGFTRAIVNKTENPTVFHHFCTDSIFFQFFWIVSHVASSTLDNSGCS